MKPPPPPSFLRLALFKFGSLKTFSPSRHWVASGSRTNKVILASAMAQSVALLFLFSGVGFWKFLLWSISLEILALVLMLIYAKRYRFKSSRRSPKKWMIVLMINLIIGVIIWGVEKGAVVDFMFILGKLTIFNFIFYVQIIALSKIPSETPENIDLDNHSLKNEVSFPLSTHTMLNALQNIKKVSAKNNGDLVKQITSLEELIASNARHTLQEEEKCLLSYIRLEGMPLNSIRWLTNENVDHSTIVPKRCFLYLVRQLHKTTPNAPICIKISAPSSNKLSIEITSKSSFHEVSASLKKLHFSLERVKCGLQQIHSNVQGWSSFSKKDGLIIGLFFDISN